MDIRALFFDVDGTLRSFDTHRVPTSTEEAIAEARKRGIRIFVATGRMPSQLTELTYLGFDGMITFNGACTMDAEGQILHRAALPREDIERAIHYLEAHDLTLSFMYADTTYVNREDSRVLDLMRQCGVKAPAVADPRKALHEPVYQAEIFVDEEQERLLMPELFPACEASRWHPLFADVNLRGVTKATGMDILLHHYGLDRSQAMAFGDGGNDIAMLRHAGVGVAMGNAADSVRLAADYVTSTVDDGGIAAALRHFGII